jgi:hypothetical protein
MRASRTKRSVAVASCASAGERIFERHFPAQRLLHGQIDRGHAALSERSQDAVAGISIKGDPPESNGASLYKGGTATTSRGGHRARSADGAPGAAAVHNAGRWRERGAGRWSMETNAIVEAVNRLMLKPLGFERRGSLFNRRRGEFVDVVDLPVQQGRRCGDARGRHPARRAVRGAVGSRRRRVSRTRRLHRSRRIDALVGRRRDLGGRSPTRRRRTGP